MSKKDKSIKKRNKKAKKAFAKRDVRLVEQLSSRVRIVAILRGTNPKYALSPEMWVETRNDTVDRFALWEMHLGIDSGPIVCAMLDYFSDKHGLGWSRDIAKVTRNFKSLPKASYAPQRSEDHCTR